MSKYFEQTEHIDSWETLSESSFETINLNEPVNFHRTFLDILFGKDPLDNFYNEIKEYVNFKFNFDLLPKCSDTVEKIAPYLLQSMKKEQELIDTTEDYYVARDLVDNTIYICFKELMVIDIDQGSTGDSEQSEHLDIDKIIKHFKKQKEMSFRIYGRKNELNNFCAYHVFCTNKKVVYRDKETISFMIANFCDFYYTVHSYIRGFCVRLNNKFKTPNQYEFICKINAENEDPELVKLVELHENLINFYSKGEICYPKNNLQEIYDEIEFDDESGYIGDAESDFEG